MLKVIIFCTTFVVVCFSIKQEITLFDDREGTGNSITFASKQPHLHYFAKGIADAVTHPRVCWAGHWVGYTGANYTGNIDHQNSTTGICTSGYFGSRYSFSMRYLGPDDTDTESISFYSNTSYRETELVITEDSATSLPIRPLSLFTTGRTNWTFFTGPNFDGFATCYTSTAPIHAIPTLNETFSYMIRSVRKSCNGHFDLHLNASQFEQKNN